MKEGKVGGQLRPDQGGQFTADSPSLEDEWTESTLPGNRDDGGTPSPLPVIQCRQAQRQGVGIHIVHCPKTHNKECSYVYLAISALPKHVLAK